MYQQHVPVAQPVHYVPVADPVNSREIDNDPNPSICDVFMESYQENQGLDAQHMGACTAQWSRQIACGMCCTMIVLFILFINWLTSLN